MESYLSFCYLLFSSDDGNLHMTPIIQLLNKNSWLIIRLASCKFTLISTYIRLTFYLQKIAIIEIQCCSIVIIILSFCIWKIRWDKSKTYSNSHIHHKIWGKIKNNDGSESSLKIIKLPTHVTKLKVSLSSGTYMLHIKGWTLKRDKKKAKSIRACYNGRSKNQKIRPGCHFLLCY